jgi:hypothetical protein
MTHVRASQDVDVTVNVTYVSCVPLVQHNAQRECMFTLLPIHSSSYSGLVTVQLLHVNVTDYMTADTALLLLQLPLPLLLLTTAVYYMH